MPEGHLLHRFALQQAADLAGRTVAASSPQGRFDVAPFDGRTLRTVEAHGKHLFYRFDGEGAHASSVHVHLGMRGIYLRYPNPQEKPRASVRMRLAADVAYDLIAPTKCEPLTAGGVQALMAKLGPDPLRDDADDDEAVRRLRAAGAPVGVAILDQAVWSGVGNAWRAELLYLARLDPRTPVSHLTSEQAVELWRLTRELFPVGRDAGQVVSDLTAPAERWVYKRPTCRGCGAPVRTWSVGGRDAWACEREQLNAS